MSEDIDFSTGAVDLRSLLRLCKKNQKAAVETLVKLMKSPDDKVALEAAKSLLRLTVDVQKEISSDSLARLVAQARSNPVQLPPSGKATPLVNFGSVMRIDD